MIEAFGFERLDAFKEANRLAKWVRRAHWPSHIQGQVVRAADSVVLNLVEGNSRSGKQGRSQLRVALGSLNEVAAVLLLVEPEGFEAELVRARRVGALVTGLIRAHH